jgi:hypothetical protein
LQRYEIAEIVHDAIMFRDSIKYDLYCSCILPTHVHMVFRPLDDIESDYKLRVGNAPETSKQYPLYYPVTEILGSLKKHTALEANKILGRRGAF